MICIATTNPIFVVKDLINVVSDNGGLS